MKATCRGRELDAPWMLLRFRAPGSRIDIPDGV